jgi:hypothetical protein
MKLQSNGFIFSRAPYSAPVGDFILVPLAALGQATKCLGVLPFLVAVAAITIVILSFASTLGSEKTIHT